jgi:hypothetical protein
MITHPLTGSQRVNKRGSITLTITDKLDISPDFFYFLINLPEKTV